MEGGGEPEGVGFAPGVRNRLEEQQLFGVGRRLW